MHKPFLILVFLVLFGSYLDQVAGQATGTNTQPLTNINNPKDPETSETAIAASTEPTAESKGLFEEGMKLAEAGQFSEAAQKFQRALKLQPEYADAYAALGRAYFKMRQWQKASENLRRAAALHRKESEAQDALRQKLAMGKRERASGPVRAIPTPETKLQQATSANAAGVKIVRIETGTTTQQPQQRKDANNSRDAGPGNLQIKLAKAADGVPPLKSDDDKGLKQKQEPVGNQVSMNVTPAPLPVETKSVTPISIKVSSDDASLTKIYRIGPSDVLDVRINDSQSPHSTLFTVTPSGLLEHPMLPEPLLVTGFTAEEIGTTIEIDLSKRALLDNPKVAVGVRDYASHTILVSGRVKDSGTKFLRREAIPLYVVVADAQPLPEATRVTVVRSELNQMYEIDLTQAADMNLLIRPGDVITLHPNVTQFIYIGGEVKSPGEKTFRRGLTLTQAIISSGGVTPKSKVAEIGRDDGRGFLVVTRFSLKDIQSGKAVDPLLKPDDRIMILR
ncbi:MAG: tetratricopeptide repeat protein [Pyrinomonadaceae bacterium]|nr:tetratricopeptide repeat protein [Pyrinomonadaceae bacterium]